MTIKIVVSELLNSHNDDSFTFHEKAILMIYSPWMILANGQMPMNQAKKDQTTTQKTLLNRARLTLPCCTRPMSENLENSFITTVFLIFLSTSVEPCGLPDQHHPEKDADYEGDSVEIVDTDSCKDQQCAQTTPGEASG